MNGVCVIFVGWLNIVKLDGVGYLMFDEDTAKVVLVPLCKLNEWMKAWRTLEFSKTMKYWNMLISRSSMDGTTVVWL